MSTFRVAILSASLFASSAFAQQINLVCGGSGAANKLAVATANAWNSNGDSATAQVYGHQSVGFEDEVGVRIDGTDGEIRVPRSMLPLAHGGHDGWFKLKNIKITDTEITGTAAINFINSPKVRLDRLTGHINISGKAGDYSGVCESFDPNSVKRRF